MLICLHYRQEETQLELVEKPNDDVERNGNESIVFRMSVSTFYVCLTLYFVEQTLIAEASVGVVGDGAAVAANGSSEKHVEEGAKSFNEVSNEQKQQEVKEYETTDGKPEASSLENPSPKDDAPKEVAVENAATDNAAADNAVAESAAEKEVYPKTPSPENPLLENSPSEDLPPPPENLSLENAPTVNEPSSDVVAKGELPEENAVVEAKEQLPEQTGTKQQTLQEDINQQNKVLQYIIRH